MKKDEKTERQKRQKIEKTERRKVEKTERRKDPGPLSNSPLEKVPQCFVT